jgi:hypothetical protein
VNLQASIRGAKVAPYPGWLAHDGVTMPVAPASQPGVAFRNGWRVPPAHYAASHWLEFGRDFWRHIGGPLDIVAFLPSYHSQTAAHWRSAVCSMISERFGREADERINERLADDIIALLHSRGTGEVHGARFDLSDVFGSDK